MKGFESMANVNGVTSRTADAHIPVMDRGFLYGDSIYEVFRTWRAFRATTPRLSTSYESLNSLGAITLMPTRGGNDEYSEGDGRSGIRRH